MFQPMKFLFCVLTENIKYQKKFIGIGFSGEIQHEKSSKNFSIVPNQLKR